MARPSCTRFHAASKRSSASPAGPMRISSRLRSTPLGIALEVVTQLLHRAEVVLPVLVVGRAAPAQAVTQVVVQLDLEDAVVRHHRLPQQQHIWLYTPYHEGA